MTEDHRPLMIFQFEDDPGEAKIIQYVLQRVWERLKSDETLGFANYKPRFSELVFELFGSNDEAFPALEEDSSYDLFVLDLLEEFGDDPNSQYPVGPEMAELARRRSQEAGGKGSAGIIAISKADETPRFRGARGSFEKAAKRDHPGPNGTYGRAFFDKSSLFGRGSASASAEEVARILLSVLIDAGVLQPRDPRILLDVDTKRSFLELRVVMEIIGKKTLMRFAERFLGEDTTECRVRYMRPGYGGEDVLRLETEERSLLLKISRSHEALQREIDHYPRIHEALRAVFVEYREDEVASSIDGEWKAIATKNLEEVETLTERIETADDASRLEALLEFVFARGLKKAYSVACPSNERHNIVDVIFPTRSARVHLALADFGELAQDYGNRGSAEFDRQVLSDFLGQSSIGSVDRQSLDRIPELCLSHGDLHGRNILVALDDKRFYLLDPASSGKLHWAVDIARLMVDLLITSWDKGPSSSTWERFDEWRRLTRSVVRWQPTRDAVGKQETAPNKGVAVALDWFRKNLGRIHDERVGSPTPGFEFQLALAVELMKTAYRLELPAAKRVLGLVAAHDALLDCEASITRSPAHSQPRVFLSYAREDQKQVRELYDRLRGEDIDAWMDENELLGGQRWREEIPKAMRGSEAIVLCLSRAAVAKRGYVQKEIRDARKLADEQPEGVSFLIPCLLERCEVPSALEDFHQVRLFEGDGFRLLVRSLREPQAEP